ncbi:Hypothetical protein PHPALM_19979 [Phytophthora palmivora]|uniref:Uncharacterized protein n=1 Tax=Phytophthora palmivora TaxID=4796 RepID=A0A2P4XG16_9STRA|nr:Hypothetical protein PHPALM_19979 [Phytophthora palmivora]
MYIWLFGYDDLMLGLWSPSFDVKLSAMHSRKRYEEYSVWFLIGADSVPNAKLPKGVSSIYSFPRTIRWGILTNSCMCALNWLNNLLEGNCRPRITGRRWAAHRHNCPNGGDATVLFHEQLQDPVSNLHQRYGVIADIAFPCSKDMAGRIMTPLKDGRLPNGEWALSRRFFTD